MQMPYLDVPRYATGMYGSWELVELPGCRQYGYFTALSQEGPYHGLMREGRVWMTSSRMERESHAFHLGVARGRVLVCGVGMGLYLYNLCRMERVRHIVAVDIDPDVIRLVQTATDFADSPGAGKVRFLCTDALQISSEQIGPEPVDHLYVDIWPALGSDQAAADTRRIQALVRAKQVGYWGQEIDLGKWHAARRATGRPSALEGTEFVRWSRLPLGRLPQPYLEAACVATQIFARIVSPQNPRNLSGK